MDICPIWLKADRAGASGSASAVECQGLADGRLSPTFQHFEFQYKLMCTRHDRLALPEDSYGTGEASGTQAQRISPHLGAILHTPRGEIQTISPHCHLLTGEPQTTCAGGVGRNSPNIAPGEKEKNFSGAKIKRRTTSSSAGLLNWFSEKIAPAKCNPLCPQRLVLNTE